MNAYLKIVSSILIFLCSHASQVQAQSASFPGADPLVCKDGDTMNSCVVTNLDPTLLAIEGAGQLKVGIVEDTRCPRFARCREPGRIVLKFSVIEMSGVETPAIELEYKRNQSNVIQIKLSDESVLSIELVAVTHKVSNLPAELFQVKIGYLLTNESMELM